MIHLTKEQERAMLVAVGAGCRINGQHPFWIITNGGVFCPTCGLAPKFLGNIAHNNPIYRWLLMGATK